MSALAYQQPRTGPPLEAARPGAPPGAPPRPEPVATPFAALLAPQSTARTAPAEGEKKGPGTSAGAERADRHGGRDDASSARANSPGGPAGVGAGNGSRPGPTYGSDSAHRPAGTSQPEHGYTGPGGEAASGAQTSAAGAGPGTAGVPSDAAGAGAGAVPGGSLSAASANASTAAPGAGGGAVASLSGPLAPLPDPDSVATAAAATAGSNLSAGAGQGGVEGGEVAAAAQTPTANLQAVGIQQGSTAGSPGQLGALDGGLDSTSSAAGSSTSSVAPSPSLPTLPANAATGLSSGAGAPNQAPGTDGGASSNGAGGDNGAASRGGNFGGDASGNGHLSPAAAAKAAAAEDAKIGTATVAIAADSKTAAPPAPGGDASATGGLGTAGALDTARASVLGSAPATPGAPLGAPNPASAVETTIRLAHAQGFSRARLSLKPAELGGVEVVLHRSSEGVSAALVADTPEAARLLEAGGEDLRRRLAAHGVELGAFSVSVAAEDASPGGEGAPRSPGGTPAHRTSSPHGGDAGPIPAQTIDLGGGVLVDVLA